MGYTHSWYRPAEIDRDTYNAIVFDFGRILPALKAAGVVLADGHGEGVPTIDANDVWFNGAVECGHAKGYIPGLPWPSANAGGVNPGASYEGTWFAGVELPTRTCPGDCSYETFYFPRVLSFSYERTEYQGGLYHDCTKTAYRPYDLAVTAFLVIAKHHMGDKCLVLSDGEEIHWFDAKMLCTLELGYGMGFTLDERPKEAPRKPESKSEPVTRWMSAAETAKAIRQALKESFPGIKFSVRSSTYSGGDSVRVAWTDGPTRSQVEEVAHQHQSVRYDESGEILSGGNRFVFCDRGISPELEGRAREYVALHYNLEGLEHYQVERYYREALENPDLIPTPAVTVKSTGKTTAKGKAPTSTKQDKPTTAQKVAPANAPTYHVTGIASWLTYPAETPADDATILTAAGWRFSQKRKAWWKEGHQKPPVGIAFVVRTA